MLQSRIMGLVLWAVVLPARRKSVDTLIKELVHNGEAIAQTLRAAPDTPDNRDRIAHMVGIERWGLNRMLTAFGEPPGEAEHDPYRPDPELTAAQMADAFSEVRTETVALAERIKRESKAEAKARHNDMGNINLKTWLIYLDEHALHEVKGIRT